MYYHSAEPQYSAKPTNSELCELMLTEVLTLINSNSCYFSRVFLASQHIYKLEENPAGLYLTHKFQVTWISKTFIFHRGKEVKIWYQSARDMYSSWSYKWRHWTSVIQFLEGCTWQISTILCILHPQKPSAILCKWRWK